jgi:hypothetical protein
LANGKRSSKNSVIKTFLIFTILNYQSEKTYPLAEDELVHLNAFIDSKNKVIANNFAIQQAGNNTRSSSWGINSLAAHVWIK